MEDNHSYKEATCEDEPAINEQIIASSAQPERTNHQQPSNWYSQLQTEFWSSIVVTVSTAVMAVFTGFLWWTSTNQLSVMRGQLDEMKGTTSQTERNIAASERIAKATESSVAQSKAALDASIEMSRLEQRAWVAVKTIRMTTLEVGKPVGFEITYANTGKTPALDVMPSMSITGEPVGFDVVKYAVSKDRPKSGKVRNAAVLPPNAELATLASKKHLPNEDAIRLVTSGTLFLYVLGEITYFDVFHRKHLTKFCFVYKHDMRTFQACDKYNTVD